MFQTGIQNAINDLRVSSSYFQKIIDRFERLEASRGLTTSRSQGGRGGRGRYRSDHIVWSNN